MSFDLQSGNHVVFLGPPNLQFLTLLKEKVGNKGSVVAVVESELKTLPSSTFDVVVSRNPLHPLVLLFEISRILRGDAIFILFEPIVGRTFEMSETLNSNLTLAGFVGTVVSSQADLIKVESKKPNWDFGATQGIKIKPKKVIWEASPNDDLMDESSLLQDEDFVKPDVKNMDCGEPGSKKACKNCTCGRSELEAGAEAPKKRLTLEMLENPGQDSSCGSCGLGDAFRCAGCPYKGLPAFKPGHRITLPDDFVNDS